MNPHDWVLGAAKGYLSFRRGLGYQMRSEGLQLLRFARYAKAIGHKGALTTELALRWAVGEARSTNPLNAARRLDIVRSFAKHLALSDVATQIPPPGMLGPSYRRIPPYIYTRREVQAILREAGKITPIGGLRPQTYKTLLGLLISTGLRISEALRLTREDVDLVNGIMTIRVSKYRKSRLVPLHPSALPPLRKYAKKRDAYHPCATSPAFFLTEKGTPQKYLKTLMLFTQLRRKLGWTRGGAGPWPRLHDFRHTFAVRRLLAWYRAGVDVGNRIVSLSTYMGHAKIDDTYWYLSAAPELMATVGARFDQYVHHPREVAQ